jgi:all-trans-retinol 13,14-reductase
MEQFDVLIIGSGMEGSFVAPFSAWKGYKVCVLEKKLNSLAVRLQTYVRDRVIFDSGVPLFRGT